MYALYILDVASVRALTMYDEVLRCMQAVALMLPCIGCFLDAPFGKFGLPSAWNVNGNVGWMLMESVAPLAVCVSFYGQVQAVIHAWAHTMLWLLSLIHI